MNQEIRDALDSCEAFATGRKTNWNTFCGTSGDRAFEEAMCAVADAARATGYAALVSALIAVEGEHAPQLTDPTAHASNGTEVGKPTCTEIIVTMEPDPGPAFSELEPDSIPTDFEVRPLSPEDNTKSRRTCGTCGLSWDDAVPTEWTPTPAARCPFEYFHHNEATDDYMSVRAHSLVTIPTGDAAYVQTIESPGLYGIDADSPADHFDGIADDEASELRTTLDALHIDHSAAVVRKFPS
jgi:hypothetical protein